MKKIDKMTKTQEALIPVYLKKWLDNGRKTTRIDQDKAKKAIITIYECAGMRPPEHFLFFPSPIQCQLAANLMKTKEVSNLGNNLTNNLWDNLTNNIEINLAINLKSNLESNLRNNLWDNLTNNLWDNLRNNLTNNLWDNIEDNLKSNLTNNLWNNLTNNIENNLRSNLKSNLRNNLGSNLKSNLTNNLEINLKSNLKSNLGNNLTNNLKSNLGNNIGANLGSNLWNNLTNNLWNNLKLKYEYMFFGNQWTWWVGFYDFVLNELFQDEIKNYTKFNEYVQACQNIHVFIPYDNIVFISDNPETMTLDSSGRLHHETEPAMMYQDGYSLFYLNGIQVPKWAIETPKHEIQPKMVLELTNTEQRAALMRHVGLAYFLEHLGAEQIHEYEGYKLYYLTVNDEKIGPYLYMKCPSSGREFLEGVGTPQDGNSTIDKSIKTCQDALKWRLEKASNNLMTKFNLKWEHSA